MLLQNLHHRYLYITIKLPHLSDLEQRIPDFLNCDNYGSLHPSYMIPVPVIVLYCIVHCINSSEPHLQGVALRSQYSDPTPEAVTLQ